MDDEKGVVAEFTEGFCQKAEVAVPEELIGADSKVGVEKDFQAGFSSKQFWMKGQSKTVPEIKRKVNAAKFLVYTAESAF